MPQCTPANEKIYNSSNGSGITNEINENKTFTVQKNKVNGKIDEEK